MINKRYEDSWRYSWALEIIDPSTPYIYPSPPVPLVASPYNPFFDPVILIQPLHPKARLGGGGKLFLSLG